MSPVPAADDDLREWLSFEFEGETFTFDVTWLMSSWTCIYGRGCMGIADEPDLDSNIGCCSHGAHFTDKADRRRVKERIALLTDEEWQFRERAEKLGGAIHKVDGDWVTRVVDDACIFLNRNDHPGGPGCAFHRAAVARGESYVHWKPEVCWQVPIRLEYHTDDNDHETKILREWKRRDWGEGGAEFHWWCTEDPHAFIGQDPVYRSCRDEIVALVGQGPYDRLASLLDARRSNPATRTVMLPHPALGRPAARTR